MPAKGSGLDRAPIVARPPEQLEGALFAGRYRVRRLLGAGAMGVVYEALDLQTERRRALKVMRAPVHEGAGERWKREARIGGSIESPFIVDVLDVSVDDDTGMWFLVMELLHGEDLGRRLRHSGPLAGAEAARCVRQAALALDRMHRAGLIHCDLKPANLFLDEREGEPPRLKILDFGIALEAGVREPAGSAGTLLYMAPEQVRGGAVSAATDVFALGMVAFTLLTGRAYWTDEWDCYRDDVSFALVAVRGPREPPCVRAARYASSLPPAFDDWFARATALDPQLRFLSAGDAARALDDALGEEVRGRRASFEHFHLPG